MFALTYFNILNMWMNLQITWIFPLPEKYLSIEEEIAEQCKRKKIKEYAYDVVFKL